MCENHLVDNFSVICNRQIVQRANYHEGSSYMQHVTLLNRTILIGYYVKTDSLRLWLNQKACVTELTQYEILRKPDSTAI